jgi:LPPG:FO 2-phospho-L-lactate transferase
MDALGRLGGETWFKLGDRDMATHVLRTRSLRAGATLSEVTRTLLAALGIAHRIVPMSDDPVRTIVLTDEGKLAFQDYFVRRKCEPRVRGFEFPGAGGARPALAVSAALADPNLAAIVFCPSNPFVSIGPILAVPGIETAVRSRRVPLVAVSPIVGGRAVKGPASRMMTDLGIEPTVIGLARHYGDLIDGIVIDEADAASVDGVKALGIRTHVTRTVMSSGDDKTRLAAETVEFACNYPVGR